MPSWLQVLKLKQSSYRDYHAIDAQQDQSIEPSQISPTIEGQADLEMNEDCHTLPASTLADTPEASNEVSAPAPTEPPGPDTIESLKALYASLEAEQTKLLQDRNAKREFVHAFELEEEAHRMTVEDLSTKYLSAKAKHEEIKSRLQQGWVEFQKADKKYFDRNDKAKGIRSPGIQESQKVEVVQSTVNAEHEGPDHPQLNYPQLPTSSPEENAAASMIDTHTNRPIILSPSPEFSTPPPSTTFGKKRKEPAESSTASTNKPSKTAKKAADPDVTQRKLGGARTAGGELVFKTERANSYGGRLFRTPSPEL